MPVRGYEFLSSSGQLDISRVSPAHSCDIELNTMFRQVK